MSGPSEPPVASTPVKEVIHAVCPRRDRKRKTFTVGEDDLGAIGELLREERLSASPSLKKRRDSGPGREEERVGQELPTIMNTGNTPLGPARLNVPTTGAPSALAQAPASGALTIEYFTAYMESINKKNEANAAGLAALTAVVKTNTESIQMLGEERGAKEKEVQNELEIIKRRLDTLEGGVPAAAAPALPRSGGPAAFDPQYDAARRSLRFWPVRGATPNDLWSGVDYFIHDLLKLSGADISEEDVEAVTRVQGVQATVPDEVLVKFASMRVRDLVIGRSAELSSSIGADGKPTAGIRLEVPPSLMDTFRILSRFGRRLRARHGDGTKRHVKFDDHERTLFCNIKLPGDEAWTKVTAEMAKRDLEDSLRHENNTIQRRIAMPLSSIPGPRARLTRPVSVSVPQADVPMREDARAPGAARWTGLRSASTSS